MGDSTPEEGVPQGFCRGAQKGIVQRGLLREGAVYPRTLASFENPAWKDRGEGGKELKGAAFSGVIGILGAASERKFYFYWFSLKGKSMVSLIFMSLQHSLRIHLQGH